jgi:circadian clock protein KaiC
MIVNRDTSKVAARLDIEATGDPAFDAILGGGLPARSVVIIAGQPGSGKTVLTHQLLFHAARQGKKCLYLTTLAEPAIKVMRYVQRFDFFDEALVERQIILRDLGADLRKGGEVALRNIEDLVSKHEPAFIAVDSFKAVAELLREGGSGRIMIYDLAVQLAGWGATALLVGEYSREDGRDLPEFGIADGIIQLGSERKGLTSVREIEVVKLRGAPHRTGIHFFNISSAGVSFFPRVSTPVDTREQPSPENAERLRTGIAGLDELLDGGLPRASTTVVQGGTGTGKTLLALQFLIEGASRGERGVLFTLEETPSQLRSVGRSLGWDLGALEASGHIVIRYTSPVELSTDRFLFEARSELQELGASRAVFDSLTSLSLGVPSQRRFKEMVYAITKHLRGTGVTTLMTLECVQLLGAAHLSSEGVSFLADNVVQLRYVELEGRLERAVSVLKARGIKHNSELRSMLIESDGIRVVSGRFTNLRGVLTGLPTRESDS